MENGEIFYTCDLRSLVRSYYDSEYWLPILEDAERDEIRFTGKERFLYGLDNCDLSPYIAGEISDNVYQLSRADMLETLTSAEFGRPLLVAPPATIIEFVHSALVKAEKLRGYLNLFDTLKKTASVEKFKERLEPAYKDVRQLLAHGPNLSEGLIKLQEMLEKKMLLSLEDAITAFPHLRNIAKYNRTPNEKGYKLLSSRRRNKEGYAFSSAVDMTNWDLSLAADHVLQNERIMWFMTTTGNLTLNAFKESAPWLSPDEIPCRHLVTPYLRVMLRHEEADKESRLNKIAMGKLALKEMLREIEKVPEALAVVLTANDTYDTEAVVGITKRLYDAMRAWLDLLFFPYLRGLKEISAPEAPEKGMDIREITDWTETQRPKIEKHAADAPRKTKGALFETAFPEDDIVERFVPRHPEAERILNWLRSK